MKLRYIAHMRLPTEKAHGIQIMSMCSAFSRAGVDVELVIPTGYEEADPFEYYDIEPTFSIRRIPVSKLFGITERTPPRLKPVLYLLQRFLFARKVLTDARKTPADVYYFRDEFAYRMLASRGFPSVWEVHVLPKHHSWYSEAFKKTLLFVAITKSLVHELETWGIPEENLAHAPDGVDLKRFSSLPEKNSARASLGLSQTKEYILYTGQLFAWKGVDTLLSASATLASDVEVLVVGGTGTELSKAKERVHKENLPVQMVGQVPHARIPLYLASADIVVIPNSGTSTISRKYTSPLKLFEALGASKAIVASDLPSLREVLNEEVAVLVPPDNHEALGGAITTLLQDNSRLRLLGEKAGLYARSFDWTARAEAIIREIRLRLPQENETMKRKQQ